VYLEDEAAEPVFFGFDVTRCGVARPRCWRNAHERIQHFLHTKIIDGAAEEYRGRFSAEVIVCVQFTVNAVDQFNVFTERMGIPFADFSIKDGIIKVVDVHHILVIRFCSRGEEYQAFFVQIVHPFEILAAVDGPGIGVEVDLQFFFDLFEEVETVLAVTVHFIDEYDHRRLPHGDHFHKPAGLRFHPVHAVNDEDDAVHCCQRTKGVFREVLVTRRIEQVDEVAIVFKGHDAGGHADAALPFDLHEIGSGVLLDLVALYRTGRLYGSAEEQEFLCQRRLSRIRVRDDGEGFAFVDLVDVFHKSGAKVGNRVEGLGG